MRGFPKLLMIMKAMIISAEVWPQRHGRCDAQGRLNRDSTVLQYTSSRARAGVSYPDTQTQQVRFKTI